MHKYLLSNEYFLKKDDIFEYLEHITEYRGCSKDSVTRNQTFMMPQRPPGALPVLRPRLTFVSADGHGRAQQLQALAAVGAHRARGTLQPGAGLEVYGVQGDRLGRREVGVEVHFSQGAGHTVSTRRGAGQPPVEGQSIVDVLARADGGCSVVVGVFRVAGLRETESWVVPASPITARFCPISTPCSRSRHIFTLSWDGVHEL